MGLYFFQSGYEGGVKIGITDDIDKRRATLQSNNPVGLLLRAWCPTWGRRQESDLHWRLRDHSIHNEWFSPAPPVYAAMNEASVGHWNDEALAVSCDLKGVASSLREARTAARLSQVDLATAAGITQGIVSFIERGGSCGVETHRRLVEATGSHFPHVMSAGLARRLSRAS